MKTILSKNFLAALSILALVSPIFVSANGGDQRIVEGGKYFINFSRAPFTPRAGAKIAMLVSIADGKTGMPVKEDLLLRIRIAKLGGIGGNREFIFEQKGILVKGGVFELSYTFPESGLHEIFFDFAFVAAPSKVYEPPDFLVDIQKPETPAKAVASILIAIASALIGGIVGWVAGRKKLYLCKECGFRYGNKEWAEKCEAWCRENQSCNIEITSHGLPPLGK